MGTVLVAWQLGQGYGHLIQDLPLVQDLIARGHKVYLVCRNLTRAADVYGQLGVYLMQAPLKLETSRRFPRALTFAQLLGNTGFGRKGELFALVAAWRNLYRLIRPDVVICDHAPAALLAARTARCRVATIGTGFCCPPDATPFPMIRFLKQGAVDTDQIISDEQEVLQNANWVLQQFKSPVMSRLGELYGKVDECFLVTFAELDHYARRVGAGYWGPIRGCGGASPQWPSGDTRTRVFAYLKLFPALDTLQEVLRELGHSVIAYGDGFGRLTRQRFSSDTLKFECERLDAIKAVQDCDLAILNASHGSTSNTLLAGKPILQVPLQPEQQVTARITSELGAGEILSPKEQDRSVIKEILQRLVTDRRYSSAARDFAQQHFDFQPEEQRLKMVLRVCDLIEGT